MDILILTLMLLSLFVMKHLVCDFFLQFEYQWRNKGIFGHPGGLLHCAIHTMGTCAIYGFFFYMYPFVRDELTSSLIFATLVIEYVSHYLMDWSKVNINAHYKWTATTSPNFWYLLGVDQTVHFMTYVLMIYMIIKPLS